ncbi:hypothetical protein VNO80_13268 [Phaseolus coccineus]|uniref:Uncharacterized protein n=1 Tax=Phaseolus coccineus TaxID=3886 RepID=A0AAN9N1D1_PHACN
MVDFRLCSTSRYLCDKEFRYLRTVRVTTVVYRGFHSKLITLLLPTFRHRAGVILYTSCYRLAESCVFNKQSLPPGMCCFPNQKIGEHPFSRSYESVHREDRPPNSKFFPGSFNLVGYDNSRYYKKTRDYGRAGNRARPSQKGFDDSSKVHIRERRRRGRGGNPRPDHPLHSNRQAWFCSQSNFVTFVYPSDDSPFKPQVILVFCHICGFDPPRLVKLSSTCSWLDRSVSGQIGRTRRFHLCKAPTPNGLSRCSHFLVDPSCKRAQTSRGAWIRFTDQRSMDHRRYLPMAFRESVLPSQCPGIHPMHSFRSCTQQENQRMRERGFRLNPCLFASHRLHKRYTEDQPNLDDNQYMQLHLQIQRASERTLCH